MTVEDSGTLIGYLVEVSGARMLARLLTDEEGFRPTLRVAGEKQAVGRVGAYVSLRQETGSVLTLVNGVRVPNGAGRSAAGALLTLTPVGEILPDGSFRRGVRHYPIPGAEVHAVAPGEVEAIFSAYRGLGFRVGAMADLPAAAVFLNPGVLCCRHFAILGQSGFGKSWAVATLIQRMVEAMPNAHIILLDLHGEYSWREKSGNRSSAFQPHLVRSLDARSLEIPYWLMSFTELVDLLIEPTDEGASVQTAFLRDTVYALKRQTAEQLGLGVVSVDAPLHFSLPEVFRQFKEANELRIDFGKTKGPLFGQFDEFLLKLQSRINDERYAFLFDPKRRNRSETLAALLRDFVGLGEPKCPITVIDLSAVPFDVRPVVSAQIGRLAFEFNYWNPRNREFPIVLICEEAHAYIPRERGGQYDGTRKRMERIAKEGRKHGVGLGVVSQRPHELSETVLSQCGTYLCLRVTNPDDQEYIRKLVPEAEANLVDILSALGRGEAMVMGEATPLPLRFQFDRPDPAPNSGDVDFNGQWKHGPEDLDVDGIVRRWWRQGR